MGCEAKTQYDPGELHRHIMTLLLQAHRSIDNESFGATDSQVGVQECNSESVHYLDSLSP